MAEALFHSSDFPRGHVGHNPTFLACFLSHEWKIFGGALELAIQIPQR
jgi:hypothetical protein